jgi:ABC-type multidrug transport system ATPase subunit
MKITATGLGKRFNREWIFKNLSYQFESGNTYAVIGPNGSGKSTLLQVLWGQVPPSDGAILYQNQNTVIPPEDIFRSIAIATSYMELVEELTLQEMISFHFKFKKIRNGNSTSDILQMLDLEQAASKLVSNFSSGMRQRLKLGLALFSETPILFLDEPTTNLDRRSSEWYHEQLARLPSEMLIIIASNQEHEYPPTAKKIDILSYKQVTTSGK